MKRRGAVQRQATLSVSRCASRPAQRRGVGQPVDCGLTVTIIEGVKRRKAGLLLVWALLLERAGCLAGTAGTRGSKLGCRVPARCLRTRLRSILGGCQLSVGSAEHSSPLSGPLDAHCPPRHHRRRVLAPQTGSATLANPAALQCSAGLAERPSACWPRARARPCCKGFACSSSSSNGSGAPPPPPPPPLRRLPACAGTRSWRGRAGSRSRTLSTWRPLVPRSSASRCGLPAGCIGSGCQLPRCGWRRRQPTARFAAPAVPQPTLSKLGITATDGCSAWPAHHAPRPPTPPTAQKLSLFSCACALAAGPVILGLDAGGGSLMAKGTIVATLASFGVFTTGLVGGRGWPQAHRLAAAAVDGAALAACCRGPSDVRTRAPLTGWPPPPSPPPRSSPGSRSRTCSGCGTSRAATPWRRTR